MQLESPKHTPQEALVESAAPVLPSQEHTHTLSHFPEGGSEPWKAMDGSLGKCC